MADVPYIVTQLNGVQDPTLKNILTNVFQYAFKTLRYGGPNSAPNKATNFQAYFVQGTTPLTGDEFAIAHGMQTTPRTATPVLDLRTPGAQLVPLMTTRAADARYLYLRSAVLNAPITLLVE